MTIEIVGVPVLNDNYVWLMHEEVTGETVVIDPAVAGPVLEAASARGWTISQIWNTHWHPDHAGGNEAIKAATGCTVIASEVDSARTPAVDRQVSHGDVIAIGAWDFHVIDVGGHTNGHIALHSARADLAFVGDALFALGCGRMFEGTPPQFWASLCRLKALPPSTLLYCAHEYTLSNAKFAAAMEPDNADIAARLAEVSAMRERGEPTVPTTIRQERATNPFMRAGTVEELARLRTAKDNF